MTYFYENILVGIDLEKIIGIRILYNVIRLPLARACGKTTDFFQKKFAGESNNFFLLAVADATALSLFQIPAFMISAFIMGASQDKILLASLVYLVDNFMFGWVYGIILAKTRRYFRKKINP